MSKGELVSAGIGVAYGAITEADIRYWIIYIAVMVTILVINNVFLKNKDGREK